MATIQSDFRWAFLHAAAAASSSSSSIRSLSSNFMLSRAAAFRRTLSSYSTTGSSSSSSSFYRLKVRGFSSDVVAMKIGDKPTICTADELHYVSVPNSDWRLALWRYHPCPKAAQRNHPLLLLSGVGTNAIGYDLSPKSSFARYMSEQGFETWILEVRGAGLSLHGSNSKEIEQSAQALSEQMEAASESATNEALLSEQKSKNVLNALGSESSIVRGDKSDILISKADKKMLATAWDESRLVSKLTDTFMRLSERLSGFLSEGQSKIMSAKLLDQISKLLVDSQLSERFNEIREKFLSLLETRQNSGVAGQIKDLSQRVVSIIEEGQRSVSPPLFDLQERFASTLEDFQKQLDLMVKYDWDFDHYLEEDVPAAMEYIRAVSKPKDGKLLAIGHSMGGILLYAMLSRYGFERRDPKLAAVVTLASSLDYTSSKSTLKLLLPLADPAQALNVPVVPLGAMLSAAYPLSSRPPYVLSWLNHLISAEDMMHPELLKKLVLNNFCTIPAKLILQLTTAFKEGGLCDRKGTFFFKDHLHEINVPILALAGDRDLICPPEAVEETVKLIPEHLVTYKVFGDPAGPHYAHYDLVGGRLAVEQLYPCIVQFLSHHDSA
ncbi:alpha/beta hydrolase family protein [Parasponia andersonii]|uniref:Alpha/beta hydrolase family protein n=1 Tax=Parasponia andersonii TaxID=3476 RepID=A0A2P5CU78_PARAD|nr:alpha/beta hydrolase family protein [Parasponia andersonii]